MLITFSIFKRKLPQKEKGLQLEDIPIIDITEEFANSIKNSIERILEKERKRIENIELQDLEFIGGFLLYGENFYISKYLNKLTYNDCIFDNI